MGAKPQPAPEGYEVAKLGARWAIFITPRDGHGRLMNFGFIVDPERTDKRLPALFPRRAQAVTYALIYDLQVQLDQARGGERGVIGGLAAAGV